MTCDWPAPAKLNLFLHITGRRADGYHLLQTVFQFLDYGDVLRFTVTDQPEIVVLDALPDVPAQQNLIVRAAKQLQQATKTVRGVRISLEKKLPMGGGLGGGSSNAATTLVALNQLWETGLSQAELAALGLKLGADVPIFIAGHAAWAEGIGEILTPVFPNEPWYLVVDPGCRVATAEIFSDPELTRDCEPIKIPGFLSGEGSNVCEAVVKKRYPAVADAISWLSQFAPTAMTGTGGCLFGRFDSQSAAQAVLAQLPENWRGFVAKACNQSPLLSAVNCFNSQKTDRT